MGISAENVFDLQRSQSQGYDTVTSAVLFSPELPK